MIKSFLNKFLLLIFSLVLALLLAEGVARLLSNEIKLYQADPLLDYVFIPNTLIKGEQNKLFPGVEIKINSQGIREDYEIQQKEENEYRILVAGDSMTFGYGINLRDTYSKQLEKFLNQQNSDSLRYYVINTGVPGRNIEELKKFVLSRVLNFDPDLFILRLDINDIEPAYQIINDGKDLKRPPFYPNEFNPSGQKEGGRIIPDSMKEVLKRYSRFYPYIEQAYSGLRIFLGTNKPFDCLKWELEILRYLASDDDEVIKRFNILKKDILEIDNFLSKNQIKFLVVIIPLRSQAEIEGAPDNIQVDLKKFLEDNKVAFIDPLENLKKEAGKTLYLPNDGHPNEKGHQIIAESIYQFLGSNKDLMTK